MAKTPVYFAASDDKSRADVADGAQLVNLFAQKAPQGAKSPMVLLNTPGTRLFADLGSANGVLGAHAFQGKAYFWTADGMYALTGENAASLVSAVTVSGRVRAADNGQVMLFVDGTRAWTFDGETVTQLRGSGIYPADNVVFFDGFFVLNRAGTGQFFYSRVYSTEFDALDFATAEKDPDPLISVLADHDELWLFGSETVEVWWNSGGADLPFSRIDGAVIEHGCVSPWVAAKADNTVFWCSPEGIVYSAPGGYQPRRISTHEVETDLAALRHQLSRAQAFTYYDEGHTFYQLTLPGRTWCFDVATGAWHRREHYDHRPRHHASCYLNAFDRHLIGDYSTGKIYEWSLDYGHDGGRPLVSTAVSAPIHRNRDRLRFHSFELDIDTIGDPVRPTSRISILLMLDYSGSMHDEVVLPGGGTTNRYIIVRDSIRSALSALKASLSDDHVVDLCLVYFGSSLTNGPGPDVLGGYLDITTQQIDALDTWFSTVQPNGSTNYEAAFDGANTWFAETAGIPMDRRVMLFLTDGLPFPDPDPQIAAVLADAADLIDRSSGSFRDDISTGVEIYAISIDLEDTTYTEQVDNTPDDGVPVIDSATDDVAALLTQIVVPSGLPLDGFACLIDWSDDGGRTWSNERHVPLQAEGEYEHRVVVRRLGQSRDRRFRLRIADPVKRAILSTGYVEVS